ncbi:hace1 [Symbiodinium natans]|uniref:Hace1 protein n=1 Tax=Symbiodinium natans TaxID=878477 RepID=A0A812KHP1_9DINO|nr:hace1 [Symbiodinium natans]
MPKGDGLGFVSKDYADLFRELHGEFANKDPVQLKPPCRVQRATTEELSVRHFPFGVLRVKLRMCGDNVAIEEVAKGEYMKWSVAEALSQSFKKLLKIVVPSTGIFTCTDEIEVLSVQRPSLGDSLWQFCEFRFDYKVAVEEADSKQLVSGVFANMVDFEAIFCQQLETRFRDVYLLTVLGLVNKRFALMHGGEILDAISLYKAAETNAVETIVALAGSTNATAVLKGDRFPCGLLNEDETFSMVSLQRTPLLAAAEAGHAEATLRLLEAKADVNYQDTSGFHALYLAAGASNAQEVVQLLLEHGADLQLANRSGYTALHNACGCGQGDNIRVLLEARADLNRKSRSGAAPVHVAAISDRPSSLEALVQFKANLDMPAIGGNTAVHEGVMQNNPGIIQKLFELKADINIESGPDNQFATPLRMALDRKKKKAAKLLKELGAVEQVPGGNGIEIPDAAKTSTSEFRLRRRTLR